MKRKRSIGRLRCDSEEIRRRNRRRLRFSVSPPPPTERRGPRIAHPGGKITHNKDAALRAYLERLREKGESLNKGQRAQLVRLYEELICMVRNWLASRGFKRTSKSLDKTLGNSSMFQRITLTDLISGDWREEEEENEIDHDVDDEYIHRSIHHSLYEKKSLELASRGEYDLVVEDDEDSPDERRSLYLNEEAEEDFDEEDETQSLLLISNVRKLHRSDKKKKRRRLRKSKA